MFLLKQPWRFSLSFFTVLLITSSTVFWASRIHNDPKITSWDVLGYYSYLPQTFIEHDPGNASLEQLQAMLNKYQLGPSLNMVHATHKNYHLAQYGFGMAIFYLPAFVTGHLIARLGGYAADGYSPPYQYSMLWWQIFYIIIAFVVLRKLLLFFFDEWLVALLLVTVFFGTNFYLYATTVYGMSHTYLFLAYVLVLYYTVRWHQTFKNKYAVGLGFVLGLMLVARPTDIFACIIPVLWGVTSWRTLKEKTRLMRQHKKSLLLLLLAVVPLPLLQSVYWKIYSGEFLYYTYRNPGEGFEFLHPHTFEFLFSFKKGWFLYTPIMLVAVVALFLTLFRKKDFTLAIVVFTCINVYVLSCWSNWWYAASYGSRPVMQSYPVYLLGLGSMFGYLHKHKAMALRIWPTVICALAIGLNLFQAWQARHDILHSERMTKGYYFAIFGKTSIPPGADSLLSVSREKVVDTVLQNPQRYTLKNTYTSQTNGGPNEFVLEADEEGGHEITVPYHDMTSSDHAWACMQFDFQVMDSTRLNEAVLAFYFLNKKEQAYAWNTAKLIEWSRVKNGWQHFKLYALTPYIRLTSDCFQVKFLKAKGTRLRIRNFTVSVYSPKQ